MQGIDRAVESNRDELEIVCRIDEYECSIDIVLGEGVGNTASHLNDDNYLLRVDDTKRRRHLGAILEKRAQGETENVAGLGTRLRIDVGKIGIP